MGFWEDSKLGDYPFSCAHDGPITTAAFNAAEGKLEHRNKTWILGNSDLSSQVETL